MSKSIREILIAEAPTFAAEFVEYYEKFYADNVEEIGHKWLSNAYDGRRERWNHVIVRCFDKGESNSFDAEYGAFNRDKLIAMGDEYGEARALEWANKIEAKLENVDGVEITNWSRGSFGFAGTRDGKKVSLIQQTVTKVSKNGVWFHQFPARIYVDGKFFSEKAYKELFGTDTNAEPQVRRESFTAKEIDGRRVGAMAQAYDRQRELKAEGIRSRVTGDARYCTITYRK